MRSIQYNSLASSLTAGYYSHNSLCILLIALLLLASSMRLACVQVWPICVDLCSVQVIVLACVLVTTSVLVTFVTTTSTTTLV